MCCEIERKEIQNSLSLTSNFSDEFAYNVMQKPGYIACHTLQGSGQRCAGDYSQYY